ncbi:ATP-binding protein [uncultured Sulfuricurvum sp.]|uniref:sensor histidine kinase n=1 Tax=uncultured Sulfuricurvum sp. TaxID=430693 RepID=UPI0026383D06|nr:ATP-binding protein [uncultured Sulfuricurvum sp.]
MEFRISSELKNIIGKDLIINDEVAIFELVKNAYDAHATRVDITFEKDKIIIQDNGKGMDLNDIENKWLFVAYSAKKDNTEDKELKEDTRYQDYRDKINLKRGFAGAKGIGRFSCDRLGSKLKLISRKVSSSDFHQLNVDWDDFEQDAQNDFINIQVEYSSPKTVPYDLQQGVILEISQLHTKWGDKQIQLLKRSLGKLINPFEVNTVSNNFQIYIKSIDSMFPVPVVNEIIKVLTMKTTRIDVAIKEGYIITSLSDRGTLIYKIGEKSHYKHLKNSSATLLYLNQKAKHNFSSVMGVAPLRFGHVLLFNNGFRVYPYGEENDDSFGINTRHQQGHSRYFATRNIIGSININEYSNQFKEKSSRDSGLIATEGYLELEEFFWEKVLKRLEKYVVGIQWELDGIIRDRDNESENLTVLNTLESKSKIIHLIKKLADAPDVKIFEFASDFLNILQEKNDLTDPIVKNLIDIARKSNNAELLDEIDKIKNQMNGLSQQKNELEKILYEVEEKNTVLFQENKLVKEALNSEKEKVVVVSQALEQQMKRNIFQSSIIGMEKEQILGLQHQIDHSSSRIIRNVNLFTKSFDINTLTEKQKKYISVILHEAEKIASISKFVTKANFNLTATDVPVDIISFIREYINELYLSDKKIIDSDIEILNIGSTADKYNMTIRPLEITTLIDNLIQNADKAGAKKIVFKCNIDAGELVLHIEDNGKGILKENIGHIFELGYTTTDGSGIGLFNILSTVKRMKGTIDVDSEVGKGTIFIIRVKNAN